MATAEQLQLPRTLDPGVVIPGIDTQAGNPLLTSTLKSYATLTSNHYRVRVLVCGGRDWRDVDLVESALNRLKATRGPIERLIHGGARGVDRMAGKWARDNGVLEWDFLPEWHRADASEGATRNQRMIAEAAPDLVVAFPGSLGTADMIERAKGAGIEVIEVSPPPAAFRARAGTGPTDDPARVLGAAPPV